MKVTLFHGDIADAPAEAVCTSTNPRLTLVMGTGAAIRDRGGFEILRECEAIIERAGVLPAGIAVKTTAGSLPFRMAIHCVASDTNYRTSENVIRACVKNALIRADEAGCRSVAMPVFASGHARFRFDRALTAMLEELRAATTGVEEVVIVVAEGERVEKARAVMGGVAV